ncbi:transporter substrate-binding domain-containing protein [Bordetella sp. BOR01]|uniref:transporter substrate-binding domain-containing protein n=1 Tax=Bordetella sp. BOR01 TaxID=2854779 RepID=UPI00351D9B3E
MPPFRRAAAILAAVVLGTGPAMAAAVTTVQPGKLTVGSDLTYPPYAYMQDGKPAGFDADFSRMLARQMSLQPVFLDTRFPDLILGMRAHRFDIVASALYVTPERHKLINYVPYLTTGSSLLVLTSGTYAPADVDALCGKRIGTIKGASWTPKLAKVSAEHCVPGKRGAIQVREYPTSPEALMALKSKAVDVMMEDAAVSHELVQQSAGSIKVTSTKLIYPIVIGLGVNKDDTALLDALNAALKATTDNGEYPALLKKYGLDKPDAADVQSALGQ